MCHDCVLCYLSALFFFFNDTATTEIYPLSLHDALPISGDRRPDPARDGARPRDPVQHADLPAAHPVRSEEHTSELQSRLHLVCRLLLEKKKKTNMQGRHPHRQRSTTSAGRVNSTHGLEV